MTISLGPYPLTLAGLSPHLRPGRDVALDRLRGLACVLMAVDHVAAAAGVHDGPWRTTVTRLAMPLFFVLAGHLVRRPSIRHLELVAWGLLVPAMVPWVDRPNVLLWLGVMLPAVALARRHTSLHLLLLVNLAILANPGLTPWSDPVGTGYPPAALMCLVLVGALAPRGTFAWAAQLPQWLGVLGAVPLTFYVGHLLLLEAL